MSSAKTASTFQAKIFFYRCVKLAAVVATLYFCVFYLTADHAYLARWFKQLHPCFYRNEFWERDFFTEQTKQRGNIFCWIALFTTLILAFLPGVRKRQENPSGSLVRLQALDYLYLLLLAGSGIWLWHFAHAHITPYMDEVFSAIHCAEIHPFQTVAYYMLPNNHLFFNLVNNLLFPFTTDHVLTGRFISGACLLALLPLLYCWCRQLLGHRLLAFLATLAISIHFQSWGFAAMNRGYELYLLCEWASFIFLWQYLRNGKRVWLPLFSIATVIGFFTLPTFLFFFAALMIAAVAVQIYRRKSDLLFLRYILISLTIVFICYLPALCFSGLKSFTANEYVKGIETGIWDYLDILIKKMRETLEYCFTGYFTVDEDVYLIIAAIPLIALLWYRKHSRLFLGFFFLLMWLLLFVISWKMKRFSFSRNLIGHLSITYAFLIITVFWILQSLFALLKRPRLILIAFPLFLSLFCYHYIKLAQTKLAFAVYNWNINEYGRILATELTDLPPKAHVGFSDESFYLLYLARKANFIIDDCSNSAAEYYIRINSEVLPKPRFGHYQLMWERGDYLIYQRKND